MSAFENFTIIFDQWSYLGNSSAIIRTTADSFTAVYKGYFIVPPNPSYIAAAINFRASDTSGDARVRLSIDGQSQTSSEGGQTTNTYIWHKTDGLDISSFGVGSIYNFDIEAREDNGPYYCDVRHILVYNVNSTGY
ncbi:MAG: hypothetical protein GWN00_27490 [Aliifodinibius sp.]|nr:hypothetical protein [Phycisphaerae bacterium]NIT59828.1 hypothetical protein [Fodinibius sp.]NIU27198.1 hypothetical protein [candidate division KSB1 bacterium]NIV69143.1 hypothetical protein [Phycisphaerae bacterium]NIW21088.1 hypothetical protein [candidate division KSB1 bacterium]